MGRKIQKADGTAGPIDILGITDQGMFLGELECGPFVTYEWALKNCVFSDTLEPCGVRVSNSMVESVAVGSIPTGHPWK